MRVRMTRTFQPVGQGAFFTECFRGENEGRFNVVYDCGTNSDITILSGRVKHAFAKKEHVDLLIISHLDKDHVNGIRELINNGNIDGHTKVMIPLYDDPAWVFAYLQFRTLFVLILRQLSQVAGCHFLFVQGGDSLETPSDARIDINEIDTWNDRRTINLFGMSLLGVLIPSGLRITYKQIWEYVPFNPGGAAPADFMRELDKKGVLPQIHQLVNVLGKKRPSPDEKALVNKVKDAYKKVTSVYGRDKNKLNISSLVILSHSLKPVADQDTYFDFWMRCYDCRRYYRRYLRNNHSACLYTGDSDLSDDAHYQSLMKDVMLYQEDGEPLQFFQIPHHGSKNNQNHSMSRDNRICAAITNFGRYFRQQIFDPMTVVDFAATCKPLFLVQEFDDTVVINDISIIYSNGTTENHNN